MVIAPIDPLRVIASVHEQDLRSVKVGQSLIVSFPYAEIRVNARVESIDPQVDPDTHTVKIRTTIPNADHRLKPGLLVRLALGTDALPARIDAPRRETEHPLDPTTCDRLSTLEQKVDRLLGEKEERLSHAKILERLDNLERKLDQLLDVRR